MIYLLPILIAYNNDMETVSNSSSFKRTGNGPKLDMNDTCQLLISHSWKQLMVLVSRWWKDTYSTLKYGLSFFTNYVELSGNSSKQFICYVHVEVFIFNFAH